MSPPDTLEAPGKSTQSAENGTEKHGENGVITSTELQSLEGLQDVGGADAVAQRDRRDMERMGKRQLFRRDFKLFPSFAFVVLVQLTWVCLLT